MQVSINALVARLDAFLKARALADFRAQTEAGRPLAEAPIFTRFDDALSDDFLQRAVELSSSQKFDDGQRARFVVLSRFLWQQCLARAAAPGDDALRAALATRTFSAAAREWTLGEAVHALAAEPHALTRSTVSRELPLHLKSLTAIWQRSCDEVNAWREKHPAQAIAPDVTQARALLKETEAAYLDLLAYALRKADPTLKAGQCVLADAHRAARAPWLSEFFKREDLLHAVTRTLEDLGVDPHAQRRITRDDRPQNPLAQTGVYALSVPNDVRLVLVAEAGPVPLSRWLNAWGQALHLANTSADLLLVHRRFGDPSAALAVGLLFESLLLEEQWLKRYLRMPAATAREGARFFAFHQLLELRTQAALVLAHHEALSLGPSATALDGYTTWLHTALKVEVPGALGLLTRPTDLSAARHLQATALEHALHSHLRQRFDEDFFRNPATGRWLLEFSAKGQTDDAAAVANVVGFPLDAMAAANRRITVMGA